MAYRLVTGLQSSPEVCVLRPGENLVGTDPGCDVVLDHPAVSRHHAVLVVGEAKLEIADLGSSNGTFVEGERLDGKRVVAPGLEIAFGTLAGRIDEVDDADAEPALLPGSPPAVDASPVRSLRPPRTTASVSPVQRFALGALPGLVDAAIRGTTEAEVAAAAGTALMESLPCRGVEIRRGRAVLFAGGDEVGAEGELVECGPFSIRCRLAGAAAAQLYRPLLEAVSGLLLLRRRRSGRSVTAPPHGGDSPAPPGPETVDPVMQDLYEKAATVAAGPVNVLIRGESGTGKEVLARYLHAASPRAEGPLVTLNCAALPRDLQESELFGVEAGVATGVDARPGKFELADGGTLFLDEIGDMALETQAKILRVLQEGKVYRLGAGDPRSARVRVVSATNRDLDRLREEGSFRDDLYHRIADWVVELPPLRDRPADIPNLAAYFLEREAERQGRDVAGISRAALRALVEYDWPGNVRQLEREIGRAVLFVSPGQLLDTSCLQDEILTGAEDAPATLKERVERFERREIARHLALHGGDVQQASTSLGVPLSTLYRKIKAYGLDSPDS